MPDIMKYDSPKTRRIIREHVTALPREASWSAPVLWRFSLQSPSSLFLACLPPVLFVNWPMNAHKAILSPPCFSSLAILLPFLPKVYLPKWNDSNNHENNENTRPHFQCRHPPRYDASAADKLQHVVSFKFKKTATAQDISKVEEASEI